MSWPGPPQAKVAKFRRSKPKPWSVRMNHFFVRRKAFAVAALSAASVLVACEDKRVKQLDTGITRDSAVSVIAHDLPPGSPPDSFPNVYKRERYLIAGKNY